MRDGLLDTQKNGEKLSVVSIKSGPMMASMEFDRVKAKQLRKKYEEALRNDDTSFWFEDQELLTAYAAYLLEYLDTRLI